MAVGADVNVDGHVLQLPKVTAAVGCYDSKVRQA